MIPCNRIGSRESISRPAFPLGITGRRASSIGRLLMPMIVEGEATTDGGSGAATAFVEAGDGIWLFEADNGSTLPAGLAGSLVLLAVLARLAAVNERPSNEAKLSEAASIVCLFFSATSVPGLFETAA